MNTINDLGAGNRLGTVGAIRRNLGRALFIVFAASLIPPVFAQRDYNSLQIVHVDEATNTALFSVWEQDEHYMFGSAILYRGEVQPWRGRTPPILHDGITSILRDVRVYCKSCSPGTVPEGDPAYRYAEIDLSDDAAGVFGQNKSAGRLVLRFGNLLQVGEPCGGKWMWTGTGPECIKGRPPTENSLGEAWHSWSDRDRLTLLLYLYDVRADGIPAFSMCSFSKDRLALQRCQPDATAEYLDAIVAVAHNLTPLPSIPDTARGTAMRANEDMNAVKTTADLLKVIREYDQVLEQAPWWADAYYNRARVEALYGLNLWAIADYERFLKLNPSPQDGAEVREKIGELQ